MNEVWASLILRHKCSSFWFWRSTLGLTLVTDIDFFLKKYHTFLQHHTTLYYRSLDKLTLSIFKLLSSLKKSKKYLRMTPWSLYSLPRSCRDELDWDPANQTEHLGHRSGHAPYPSPTDDVTVGGGVPVKSKTGPQWCSPSPQKRKWSHKHYQRWSSTL